MSSIKKYSGGRYAKQKHSWGINRSDVHIDVVPVVAPSIMERGLLGKRSFDGCMDFIRKESENNIIRILRVV